MFYFNFKHFCHFSIHLPHIYRFQTTDLISHIAFRNMIADTEMKQSTENIVYPFTLKRLTIRWNLKDALVHCLILHFPHKLIQSNSFPILFVVVTRLHLRVFCGNFILQFSSFYLPFCAGTSNELFSIVNVSEILFKYEVPIAYFQNKSHGSVTPALTWRSSRPPVQSRDLDNLCRSQLYRVVADRCFRFILNIVKGKRSAELSNTSLNLMWNEAVKFPLNLFFSIIFWHLLSFFSIPHTYLPKCVSRIHPILFDPTPILYGERKKTHMYIYDIPNSGSR